MKKFLAVVVVLLLVGGAAMAQDVQPAVKGGSKSLNFTFGGLGAFGLGASGIGGGIGISYFLAQNAAARIGIQVVNAGATNPANPPAGSTGTDGTQSAFQFGVGADYLMYMAGNTARVRPYMGAGVSFGMASTSNKNPVISPTTQTEVKNALGGETIGGVTYNAGTTLGVQGIVGAEFFLYPEISVSGEYNLNLFSSTSGSDQEVISGATTTTTKGGSFSQILGFSAVGARIQIYF